MSGAGFSVGLDLFPLLAATLASVTCALLGNFLVLRRLSLMGDAISHSVLPGLVIAFLLAGTRSSLVMFAGAAAAGIATVMLVEIIKRLGKVESGAAMGVVFSVLFALGVLLIETAAARQVDLDADCVLHGQLETLVWYGAPESVWSAFSFETLRHTPRQVWTLLGMLVGASLFVGVLFKELRIAAFDGGLATTLGFHAGWLHHALMVFVAGATVASFEAVGSILVIAMLICPPATARLLTDRLSVQLWLSVAIAVVGTVAGYLGATWVPGIFGLDSVNAAGSVTVVSGGMLAAAVIGSPGHGVVARALRRRALRRTIARDDVVGVLYRASESGRRVDATGLDARGLRVAERQGLVVRRDGMPGLTERGRRLGTVLVRRHRLWEGYLVDRAGLPADHVHAPAEVLKHLGIEPETEAQLDPHGRPIPDARGQGASGSGISDGSVR